MKTAEETLATARAWKAANRERIRAYRAEYYQRNKATELENWKRFHAENPEAKRGYDAAYRAKNRERLREYRRGAEVKEAKNERERNRYNAEPSYRIEKITRAIFRQCLQGKHTPERVVRLIGCTREELIVHLEKQFAPGMTWENYGRQAVPGWDVDHIRPVSSFDLTDGRQADACWHWSNLQPLWQIDNLRKMARNEDSA
jgi:hypothetical protein